MSTVTILPETDDKTLCLTLSGLVNAEDYMEFFDKPVKDILARNGFYSLYVNYVDFINWSPEAAELSFKCLALCGPKARRAAYVNPPDKRMVLMKTLGPVMPAEVRYFNKGEEDEAMAWVKSA